MDCPGTLSSRNPMRLGKDVCYKAVVAGSTPSDLKERRSEIEVFEERKFIEDLCSHERVLLL